MRTAPRPSRGASTVAFRHLSALGTRNVPSFRGDTPTARTLTRLRIADRVTAIVARLATGLGGLTPGRAGFAPTGRQTKFHGVIAPPFLFDQSCLVAQRSLVGYTLLPFLIAYLYGLTRLLSWTGIRVNPLHVVTVVVVVAIVSEVLLTGPVFGSAYNWFHLF